MDEMRDALLKLAYNIRKMTGGLMMEEKKLICLRDILDLLGRDQTMVTLYLGEDDLVGNADCPLWEPLEDREVEFIGVNGADGLDVFLRTEAKDDED